MPNIINKKIRGNLNNKSRVKKKIINTIVIILSLISAISGSFIIYANSALSNMYNPFENSILNMSVLFPSDVDSNISQTADLPDVKITGNFIKDPLVLNIALFGSDVRPDENNYGNSDTILLASIDNRRNKLKLISFMRDTWVNIPELGFNAKLNAAYAVGGPNLAVDTLERNFGIDIDRYAVVDFQTFPKIIDVLGGVDIELSEEEAAYLHHDFPNRKPTFDEAGVYHLNGQEALDHSRNRKVGQYDFERTQRQRNVMMTLINKFRSTKDISTVATLMTQILPSVTTNITVDEMTGLAQNSIKYLSYPFKEFRIPTDDNYRDSYDSTWGSILVINDIDQAREDIARFIYEETINSIYPDQP